MRVDVLLSGIERWNLHTCWFCSDTVLANMQVAYWVTLQKKKKKQQQKRDTRAINGQFRLEQKNEK